MSLRTHKESYMCVYFLKDDNFLPFTHIQILMTPLLEFNFHSNDTKFVSITSKLLILY